MCCAWSRAELTLCLCYSSLIRGRIDLSQQLALPYSLTFPYIHPDKLTVDARLDRHRVMRRHRSQGRQIDRHRLLLHMDGLDRDRPIQHSRHPLPLNCLLRGVFANLPDCCPYYQGDDQQNDPLPEPGTFWFFRFRTGG